MHSKLLRLALPVAILAIALFAAACGSDDEPESGPDPIAMVPADAPFYMEMVVRPEGELKDNLESAVGKLTGEDDPGAQIIDGLNGSLAEDTDLNYEDDIKPWLGSRAGVFVSGFQFDTEQPDAALVVATTDSDAAQGFVDSTLEESGDTTSDETYEGVSYKLDSEDGTAIGVDNDFLIVGTEQAFKAAVDAGSGDSLADNGDATAALDEAPDDSVFSMYADGAAITDLIKSSPDLSAQESKQLDEAFAQIPDGPVEAWGTVTDSSFSVEGSAPTPDDAPAATDLITTFPADSWFATASTDVGEQITTQLQQFQKGFEASLKQAKSQLPPGVDASQFDPFNQIEKKTGLNLEKDLGWIGDAGAFFEGTSVLGVGAGVVAESNDDKAATAALDKLQASLEKNRSLRRQAEIAPNSKGDGFTVSAPPFTAEFAVRDGKAVMAAGSENVDSVLDPDETLADSDRFSAATGNLADGATPTFFLDMPSLLALIESQQGATDDPDYAQAAPYLHAIDYMVAGTGTSGDRTVGSFVLGVKESDDAGSDAAAAMITP
ncbi:MAG: DUF3352 domain-containing protein [Solirubrobacterales bacterium]|nr:DUF3352 domain-containing protein [Solirubrobacterales bacterium]